MTVDIADKVAVVTGASRGIGYASASALAKEGVHVVASARNADQLNDLVKEVKSLGVRGKAVVGDLSQEADVAKLKEEALAEFGQVDILVNNVGVAKYATVLEHTIEDYDWMMNTNVRSTFMCTHAFLPQMLERGSGSIITVSSQAGLHGYAGEAIYCATKFAQIGFSEALDKEVREKGIKVSVIAPGGVGTTFAFGTGRYEGMPALEQMLDAEDVADAVVFAAKQSPNSRILVLGMRPMSESM
jgi:3-oxoacyl-[acyl-carrier protein] reductase